MSSTHTTKKSTYRTRFLALWCAAVLATAAAFVAHLALRFETVRLGYQVGEAQETRRELIERRRMLALEAATMRQAARIEAIARSSLGMKIPEPDRIVSIDEKETQHSNQATAGRVR